MNMDMTGQLGTKKVKIIIISVENQAFACEM
jgi:hypothetical protein